MNEHLQRGPHPPNMSHVLHYEGTRPPPTPREMYAEGMYASIDEQGHYDHKKQAPPPPKRDPNTRLSSSSQLSNYQEIHVQESHHHQHHHQQQHQQQHHHNHHQQHHHQQQYSDYHSQQQQHHHHDLQHHQQQQYSSQHHQYSSQQNQQQFHHQQHQQQFIQDQQSPRHSGSGSPAMRSKFSHEPQSPSHSGDKPFSYGQIMSPKLNRTLPADLKHNLPNGIGHTQVSPMSPTRQREESPVMSYGKRESTFPSQAHSPPPHGPPPPVPQGQGSASPQYPSSPVLPRHSITSLQGNVRKQEPPRSPIPKLSQRSMSVPCNGNERQLINSSIGKPQPAMSAGYGYNGMGHSPHRTPSPPLPPPPPELLDDSYPEAPPPQQYHQTHHHQSHHHQQHQTQHQQSHMLSQMSHGAANQSLPKAHSQSPPRQTSTATSRTSRAPPPPPLSSIPRTKAEPPVTSPAQSVPNLDHLNRPRKGSYPVDVNGNTTIEQATRTKSQSPSVSPMRGSYDAGAEQSGLLQQINKVQLKKTGGRQSFDEGQPQTEEVKNTPPSPQAVPLSPPVSKETSPSKEAVEVIPVNSAVNMFEKKVESVIKEESRARRRGDTSKNSSMDINIDDIDLNEVPGYTPVTKSTPIWKRDMIEKKNQEKIEEYIAKKRKEKEDAEKWKNVPAWKRKLMMEKEKEKEKKSEAELQQPAQKNVMKQEEEQRKIRIREQQEMEKRMDEELQDVPAWKREIMMKRGGAIKNWTDEREEINELELEEQQRLADMEAALALESLPPPPLDLEPETPVVNDAQKDEPTPSPAPPPTQTIQQSKASVVLKPQIPKEPEVKKVPRPSIDESKLEDEWDSLPLWKKEIMMKRGGAPTNWGDEREEKNEDGVEQ